MLERVVGTELEVRGDAQLEVLAQPVAHEAPGAVQRRHRRLPLRVVAQDRDEDLGRAQVLRRLNLGDGHEAEPRVLELALQQHRDFFLDELVDAVEPFALHQRISTVVSRTMPSTWSSMKSIAFDTTSLAWRAALETEARAGGARPPGARGAAPAPRPPPPAPPRPLAAPRPWGLPFRPRPP